MPTPPGRPLGKWKPGNWALKPWSNVITNSGTTLSVGLTRHNTPGELCRVRQAKRQVASDLSAFVMWSLRYMTTKGRRSPTVTELSG
ncbi:coiled-coil domain-containing protein 69 isoform X2 [Babesia caballi]|uniref:Coiled-coil domain-containing protein 69 isoform X2 n=1 Tax=Babesia caballi TaxID=5871 RepID=A0AAV4LUI5_BABCB|nr:coiled-coil domain-containing protein 69 isoform X2 [Babesia caballi]GIX63905.1 coiled-coil domain-containing protein 69 isoform X2 [Babesia caballi]GIX63907.1 coiled-coil domain-containing protein 69 isoform X2 [Babesia caballi]